MKKHKTKKRIGTIQLTLILWVVVAVFAIVTKPNIILYVATAETPVIEEPLEIIDMTPMGIMHRAAVDNHIDEKEFIATMKCENVTMNPTLQSYALYTFSDPKRGIKKGEREKSYGPAQYHLPDHPDITYEQATDMEWAYNRAAQDWAKGLKNQWSCYRFGLYKKYYQ